MENLELCYRLLFLYKFSLRETNFTKQLEKFMLISFTHKTYTLTVQEKGRQQGTGCNSELLLQIHSKILQSDGYRDFFLFKIRTELILLTAC